MQAVFIKAAHFLAFDHNADDIFFGIDSQMRVGITDLGNGFFIACGRGLFLIFRERGRGCDAKGEKCLKGDTFGKITDSGTT